MQASLPPGPRAPSAIQTLGWWSRPTAYMERCRKRYGKRFTIRLLNSPPFVMLSDSADIKEVIQASPEDLHPGEGAKVLEPFVRAHSVILLDEGPHLEQRKLMLPAFHGKRIEELEGLVTEIAERELDSWPRDTSIEIHPRMQKLTLEVILRAVFGLDEGERLDEMRDLTTEMASFGNSLASLNPEVAAGPLARITGWERFNTLAERSDANMNQVIDERRADGGEERPDVMAMFLAARHEDGSPMSNDEVRNELSTMVVAGHETTASELAWAFEALVRHPHVLDRLQSDPDDDDYMTAVINETMRRRPVLPNAEPRLTKREIEIGGHLYPEGVCLVANAYLLHHDPAIYPDPYAFRPERFLEEPPGTYTWIPFGGGRRRCLGASFAILEMKTVLRNVLTRYELGGHDGVEVPRRRSITISPGEGARTVLRERLRTPQATAA